MCNQIPFTVLFLLVAIYGNYLTIASVDTSLETSEQQNAILNAFTGCNIRVINFNGLNIGLEIVKEPFMLIRYLTHCKTDRIYPFELGSTYSELKLPNSSSCSDGKTDEVNLPPDSVANTFVSQTLTESFQLTSKNKICEANVYLEPPTEQDEPQMYMYGYYWGKVLKDPIEVYYDISWRDQRWKGCI